MRKIFCLLLPGFLFSCLLLDAQSNLTISSGARLTVNGPLLITNGCGNPITDARDGKTYSTVMIGTQCWMAQNLNFGTRINGSVTQTDNSMNEKYCYDDIESNCDLYGGLYQWDEVMQYVAAEGGKGICPLGWHVPTNEEWTTLTSFLGGESVAGGKMKEAGTSHWTTPNTGATNESGFTALPCGFHHPYGTFYNLGINTDFWSSTLSATFTTGVFIRFLSNTSATVTHPDNGLKINAFSVRCLRD